MIKPQRLDFGDTIGIVAPSSPAESKKVEKGKDFLEKLGFKVKIGQSCLSKWGYLSGSDDIRARDINEMFSDEEVKGIICLRGGYGTPRILPRIDYENISKNPKVYIGYSDITGTHIPINQRSQLITFHGPMATEITADSHAFSRDFLFREIMDPTPIGKINNPDGEEIKALYQGYTEGIVVGGNLTLICSTLGSPYEIDTRNKILFLEEIGEEPYRIDRMLTQLKLADKLNNLRGIILGDWKDCKAEKPEKSLSLMEVFENIILPLKVPTIYNVKAGHCKPMVTIPLGGEVALDAHRGELYIKEGVVR